MKPICLSAIITACLFLSPFVAMTAGAESAPKTIIAGAPAPEWAPQAGWDYRMGAGARTKPYGVTAYVEGGYNLKIWGDTSTYSYGYVRPSAKLATSGILTTAEAELALYPISFFGLKAHTGRTERMRSPIKSLDCGTLECEGKLDFNGFSADLTVGHGPYFVWANWARRVTRPERLRFDFFDDNESIVGARGGDQASVLNVIAGMKVAALDGASVGVYYRRADFEIASAFNELTSLVYVRNWKEWRLGTYVGAYSSSLQSEVAQIGISLEWIGRRGLTID